MILGLPSTGSRLLASNQTLEQKICAILYPLWFTPTTHAYYIVHSFACLVTRVIEQLLYLIQVDCLLQLQLVAYFPNQNCVGVFELRFFSCSSCLQVVVLCRACQLRCKQCLIGLTFVTNTCTKFCLCLVDFFNRQFTPLQPPTDHFIGEGPWLSWLSGEAPRPDGAPLPTKHSPPCQFRCLSTPLPCPHRQQLS